MNLLIVDDETEFTSMLKAVMPTDCMTVTTASSGSEALERISSEDYDLIFIDFDMPGMTGIELAKTIRMNDDGIRLVMISGYQHISETLVKSIGITSYMEKPVKIQEIMNLISDLNSGGTQV